MKKILLLPLVITAVLLTGCGLTDMAKSANTLFSDIQAGNIQVAYNETSKEFQTSTTIDQFKTFLEQSTLITTKSTTRNEKSLTNNQGSLTGFATLTDGTIIPLVVNLIKENGKWGIYNILITKGGITDQTATGDIITPTEAITLINGSIGLFADAVLQGNFDTFYANISEVWKQQTTAAALQEIFQKFIDKKVDLSFTKTATPNIPAAPTINEKGILIIQGAFPIGTGGVVFQNQYIKENNAWKLFGINIQIQ